MSVHHTDKFLIEAISDRNC